MNKFLLPVILLALFLTSCKKQQVFTSPQLESNATVTCEVDNIDFTYLNLKGKISYKDAKNEHKTNINIRIKKDSITWISINAAAGFEAFRILAKPDSIHFLDKLSNTYTARDYISLSNLMGIPLSYSIIQNMIIGNLMIPREEEDVVVQTDSTHCNIRQFRNKSVFTNTVSASLRKIESVQISDGINNLLINYLKFIPLGHFSFPAENTITLTIKNKEGKSETTNITIEHNKTEFPEKDLNFPFNVPNKFERK